MKLLIMQFPPISRHMIPLWLYIQSLKQFLIRFDIYPTELQQLHCTEQQTRMFEFH
jgi:hypothetical protein